MNLLSVKEGTVFLPMRIPLIQLLFRSLEEIKFPSSSNDYNIKWSGIFAGMNLFIGNGRNCFPANADSSNSVGVV
jgi:hypothetical protein